MMVLSYFVVARKGGSSGNTLSGSYGTVRCEQSKSLVTLLCGQQAFCPFAPRLILMTGKAKKPDESF
jgi:hypothetical protein